MLFLQAIIRRQANVLPAHSETRSLVASVTQPQLTDLAAAVVPRAIIQISRITTLLSTVKIYYQQREDEK